MISGFGPFITATLLVVGMVWCAQVFRRLPQDVAEFKSSKDGAARTSMILIWVLTLGVLAWTISRIGNIVMALTGAS